MLVLISNFDNFGAMIAASIGPVTYDLTNSSTIELEVLALFATALLIVALGVRYTIPESVRWFAYQGKSEKAESEVQKFSLSQRKLANYNSVMSGKKLGLVPRIGLLVVLGISQYFTYGLMTYIIAD